MNQDQKEKIRTKTWCPSTIHGVGKAPVCITYTEILVAKHANEMEEPRQAMLWITYNLYDKGVMNIN